MVNKIKTLVKNLKKGWKKEAKHRTEFEKDLKVAVGGIVENGTELSNDLIKQINK